MGCEMKIFVFSFQASTIC